MSMTMPMSTMDMNMSSGMNMGGMDMACPMDMYFHTGSDDCILFKQWKFGDGFGAIGSCILIIGLALLR